MSTTIGVGADSACIRRLKREYISLSKEPMTNAAVIRPLETNYLHCHFLLHGEPFYDTPFEGGVYHGVIKFPTNYPTRPPSIMMVTPSGRFQCNTRICFSMSDFHPELWNPMWNIRSILIGLVSFMNSKDITTGGLKSTDATKTKYAKLSLDWITGNSGRNDPIALQLFREELQQMKEDRNNTWPPKRPEPAATQTTTTKEKEKEEDDDDDDYKGVQQKEEQHTKDKTTTTNAKQKTSERKKKTKNRFAKARQKREAQQNRANENADNADADADADADTTTKIIEENNKDNNTDNNTATKSNDTTPATAASSKAANRNKKKREREKRKKLVQKFLDSLRRDVPVFMDEVRQAVLQQSNDTAAANNTLDISGFYPPDHVCYRTESMKEYQELVAALASSSTMEDHHSCTLLIDSTIGGRSISTFQLKQGIPVSSFSAGGFVDVLEIPAPKEGSPYPSGLEHCEFVIPLPTANSNSGEEEESLSPKNNKYHQSQLEAFVAKHPHIKWNVRGIEKDINPEVSFKVKTNNNANDNQIEYGIKFHLFPLSEVIEYEKQQLEH